MFSAYLYEVLEDGTTSYCELDCEGIDVSAVYQQADLSDISVRKDTVTKSIVFKGTDKNNLAFGSMFRLDRHVDPEAEGKLFFNFAPIKMADCLLYEDSLLILKGSLLLTDVHISDDDIQYAANVTGTGIGLKGAIGDKVLADIDLEDLRHTFAVNKALDTLGPAQSLGPGSFCRGVTYTYNAADPANDLETPFAYGLNYVYPAVEYGERFRTESADANVQRMQMRSLRPALWVNEYFKRIFKEAGYTFEIKGTEDFKNEFLRLLIPNSQNGGYSIGAPHRQIMSTGGVMATGINQLQNNVGSFYWINFFSVTGLETGGPNDLYMRRSEDRLANGITDTVPSRMQLQALNGFVGPIKATVILEYFRHTPGNANTFSLRLLRRPRQSAEISDFNTFETVGEVITGINTGAELLNYTVTINVPTVTVAVGDQFVLQMYYEGENTNDWRSTNYAIVFGSETQDSMFEINTGVSMVPVADSDVKQIDLIKSIMLSMNMFMYSDNANPKHMIFERWSEYYALTGMLSKRSAAINWSNKVNTKIPIKIISNVKIPKSYLFTFKDDTSDAVNSNYKNTFKQVYGSFSFTDSLGLSAQKKVELIFAPAPVFEWNNTGRKMVAMFSGGLNYTDRAVSKQAIKVVYYNGLQPCVGWQYGIDQYSGNDWVYVNMSSTMTKYGAAHEFLLDGSGQPIKVFNFGRPALYYAEVTEAFINAPTLYTLHWIDLVSEISDINLFTIEAEVYLNAVDINNLSLKLPILLDLQKFGCEYFKIISVEYPGGNTTSTVNLQKIVQ